MVASGNDDLVRPSGDVTGEAAIVENEKLRKEIAERDARIVSLRDVIASLEGKQAALESSLINHASEIELLKRRLFGPRSERTGTSELQLTLGDLLADEARLQKELEALTKSEPDKEAPGATSAPATADASPELQTGAPPASPPASPPNSSAKPKGRRDLSASKLPKVVVEFTDPELAKQGRLIGYDESRQLIRETGGFKVLVKRTAKYEVLTADGSKTVLGVEMPRTLFPRALLHTSVLAWLAVEKFSLGVPCYRLEQHLACEGERLDRGDDVSWAGGAWKHARRDGRTRDV